MSASKAPPQGASGSADSGAPVTTVGGALAGTATPVPVTDPAQMSAALAAMRQQGERWRNYAYLLERIRQARNLNELNFSLANEVWQLFPYTQGFVWQVRGTGSQLRTVSGLAQLAGDSPDLYNGNASGVRENDRHLQDEFESFTDRCGIERVRAGVRGEQYRRPPT